MRRFNALFFWQLGIAPLAAAPFYSGHDQGWFWYQSPPVAPQVVKKASPTPAVMPSSRTALEKVRQLERSLEEAIAQAVLQPTLAHVQQVMTLQRQILHRATVFQERWMEASLWAGHQDRMEDNGAPVHRQILHHETHAQRQAQIRLLAKDRGLFFLFKKSCPYCHAFAPFVKQFAQEYGFEVKAISADNSTLPDFPGALIDNGIVQRLNPQGIYPALFLAHPASGQVIPVAWGLTSPDQLVENFATVLNALEGKTIHGS